MVKGKINVIFNLIYDHFVISVHVIVKTVPFKARSLVPRHV